MFSEVVILYLKRVCSIKNTISYYCWEFSTCRFSKASFLLVTKQPSTGHRSITQPGLDEGPALLSDVQAGGTTAIAAGSSSRIVELGSSICSSSVFHWFQCPYPKRKYRARVPTILMPPTFPIASLNRYTPNFSGVPQKWMSVWDNGPPPYHWISFSDRFCWKFQLWRRLYREGCHPKVSMNRSFWIYFWYIQTTYWLQYGYILPTC